MRDANDIYIENLNNELSLVDDINSEAIYKDFDKFIQNKTLFRDLVNSGGFIFEYIWYTELIKDSVWEDGMVSIIETYRNAKNKNSQDTIDWLNKCCKKFDLAGERWTLKARNMIEIGSSDIRLDIELNKTMEFIGGVIEGVIKPYICFVNGCFSIAKGKVPDPTIDLGVMIQNIINKDAVFAIVYRDMLENEKISDWRNSANREKYSLLADSRIELVFGKSNTLRKKILSIDVVRIIAKQVDVLAYMNKIALEIIKIDEIENISNLFQNKSKNEYKKRDDLLVATVEYAAKSGLRLVNIDFEAEEAVFVEEAFNREKFIEFLNKMRVLYVEEKLKIIVSNRKKVHYTCDLSDKSGKIMIWKV